MTMKNDAKFEEKLNCQFKIDMRNLTILTRALKNLKNLYFNGLLLNRVYVWATKKYRGVMFDGTEYWCNIWRKTDLCFRKWHEEFSKFSPEPVRRSKNVGLWWDPFIQRRKCMSLRFTGKFCVMAMKNDAKFEEKLIVSSKLTLGIWRVLTRALENLKNLYFNRLLLTKAYNVWAKKKYGGVMFDGTEYWCKIWRKNDLCFQKWHEEFSKFSPEHVRKSKNWDFDGILLSKVENAWP